MHVSSSGQPVFERTTRLAQTKHTLNRMFGDPFFLRRRAEAGDAAYDFVTGTSQEMPLPGYVEALQQAAIPQHPNWFAYGRNGLSAREAIVKSLRSRMNLPFEPADVFITVGGSGAINVGIKAVTNPGDEVIFFLPPWFFYEFMIVEAGLTPVKVSVDLRTFDLDLTSVEAAITPRTRLVIVNSPNNPTGRIYRPELLARLADVVDEASQRNGQEIYNRVIFDSIEFHSPLDFIRTRCSPTRMARPY